MADKKASVEVVAKTVEEAIEQGLAELGLSSDQVDIEIVNSGRGGLLGLGAQDATVRLTALEAGAELAPEATAYAPPVAEMEEPAQDAAGDDGLADSEPEGELDEELDEEPALVEETEVSRLAGELLQGIVDRMGVSGEVVVRSGEDLVEEGETPPLILDVTGRDLGILIGRQGETLQALQYLTRLMLSRQLERWEPVVVDVESYRARRRRSLRRLAQRMAERAAMTQRRVVLEAMPAYERRIVHLALRDHPDVVTKSVGEGDNRKVTIVPK